MSTVKISLKSRSLLRIIIILILVLLLTATGLLVLFNLTKSKDKLVELNTEQMLGIIQTFAEILDGDSIELDLLEKRKNAYYNKWDAIGDSTLKRNGIKYLYVMNIAYGDSIETYIDAKSHLGKSDFLEKENIADFNIDAIKKLKDGKEPRVSFISYSPNYGWLISSYAAIKNSKGETVAFVGADKEMDGMDKDVKEMSYYFIFASVLFVAIVFFVVLFIIRRMFIHPITKIIGAANDFNLLGISFENLGSTHIKEYDILIESFRRLERKINDAVKKSFTDDLTKLKNRHFFTISMGNILKLSHQKKKIAFFVIDIDYFKHVNDTYGHDKGDFVLKSVGAVLQELFGDLPGVVARLGGDEFAVCLDNIDSVEMVEEKCKALNEQVSKIKCSESDAGISVSIGVTIAEFSTMAPRYSDIFSTADATLYKVKAKGRNGHQIIELKAD
jgi:diguanylate cyclase (GGDEF)-like protein